MRDTCVFDESVRRAIYLHLAATGVVPDLDVLADEVDGTDAAVDQAIARLADDRHVVLDGGGTIVMAHPFATVNLGFSVMGANTRWWGGCGWESFAIPHLVPGTPEALVATTCPQCERPLAWTVTNTAPPDGDEVMHFPTPMHRVWDDVVSTCAWQRIYCSRDCLDRWLGDKQRPEGYVTDLETLWRLASHWYDGRLDSPYERREPAEAKDYFRSVGLEGPFWGLDD